MSQAKQSKQPVIDLDTEVYLWNDKIIAFTLLDYFTYFLTHPSALCSLDVNFFSQSEIAAHPGELGRKLCWFMLRSSLQLPVSGTTSQGPWAYPDICLHVSLISRIFPHFQHLSSSQDLCCLLSWPLFLLSGTMSSFWEPLFLTFSSFQNPKP